MTGTIFTIFDAATAKPLPSRLANRRGREDSLAVDPLQQPSHHRKVLLLPRLPAPSYSWHLLDSGETNAT
jgi:hypothetical protein